MTVDFALLLYDEFNGAPINDESVLFKLEDRIITPLRKSEGFYVFGGLGNDEVEFTISRPRYQPICERIIKSGLDPGFPVKRVRLRRAYSGTFSDCEWIAGDAPPGSEVLALAREELKLQAAETNNKLTILGKAAGLLIGRRFSFEAAPTETFIITGMAAPGVYTTENAPNTPEITQSALLRAYIAKSGADGRYDIPVEHGHKDALTGTAYYDRGESKWVFASAPALS